MRLAALLAAVAAVGLSGCGGSHRSNSTASTATPGTTTSGTSTPPATTTTGSGSTSSTASTTTGSGSTSSTAGTTTDTTTAGTNTSTASTTAGNSTTTPAPPPAGGPRLPATFTIGPRDAVNPPIVAGPSKVAVVLTVVSADRRPHRVVVRIRPQRVLQVPAGGRASLLLSGLADGSYVLEIDGGRAAATIQIGAQPGP